MKTGFWLSLLVAGFCLVLQGCGGGGSGDDSGETATVSEQIQGTWKATSVTLSNENVPGWSENYANFSVVIDGDQISASAEDEYWNWGPVAYTLSGNTLTTTDMQELEGGDTVLLSVSLTYDGADNLSGVITVKWWVEESNEYFTGSANITAARQ